MRKIYFFLLCLVSTVAQGQTYSTSFNQFVQDFCPFNIVGLQTRPEGWDIYQTTNGFWDGPLDSTRCISADQLNAWNGMKIALNQINPSEPVFIRARPEEFAFAQPLQPNWVFNLTACADMWPDTASWIKGSTCEQGVCSGVFVGIAIPDSFGTPGAATRFQTGFAQENGFFCGSLGIETCFPSEYFADQNLREIILKFSFPVGADLTDKYLNISNLFINPSGWQPGYVTEVKAQDFHYTNGEYTLNIAEASSTGFWGDFLMLYTAPTYPDNNHQSYVEAAPEPNTPDQQVINLVVDEFQSLEIQPYTNLRGAFVEGGDSLRHIVNLVNLGGDLCANFVDFIVSGGGEYRHGGGTINMQNPRSCMQFRTGSALRVLEGSTLYYGNEGAGMLVLCPSSTLAIERNATLVIDALLNMPQCKEDLENQQVYVDLPPGSTLRFTENARISNAFSLDQKTLLHVNMLGGTLDDSALPPADRALIRRDYPEASPSFLDNVAIFPNPFGETLTLRYLAKEAETMQLSWLNLSGQTVLMQTLQAQKGMNEWQPGTPASSGLYLLSFVGESGKTVQKVLRTGH